MTKTYTFEIGDKIATITAEAEGVCRYMVRMSLQDKPREKAAAGSALRIGYLTGRARTWVAEFGNTGTPARPATSAKAACRAIADWALTQPPFR
ncbi:MAG: hypothetical protein OEL20_04605 [Sulfuritalea sp.]|nr:hypothetical protein [Sulfuritalea sp.]